MTLNFLEVTIQNMKQSRRINVQINNPEYFIMVINSNHIKKGKMTALTSLIYRPFNYNF